MDFSLFDKTPNHYSVQSVLAVYDVYFHSVEFNEFRILDSTIRVFKDGDKTLQGDNAPKNNVDLFVMLVKIMLEYDHTKTRLGAAISGMLVSAISVGAISAKNIPEIISHFKDELVVVKPDGIVYVTFKDNAIAQKSFVHNITKSVSMPLPVANTIKKQEFVPRVFRELPDEETQRELFGGWYIEKIDKKYNLVHDVKGIIPIAFNPDTFIKGIDKPHANSHNINKCEFAFCTHPHNMEKATQAIHEHEMNSNLLDDAEVYPDMYCRLLGVNASYILNKPNLYGDNLSLLEIADSIPRKYVFNHEKYKKLCSAPRSAAATASSKGKQSK